MYILASLDLNHHIPIIQNFPHKICIRTKFWTFPTKDNNCPSMHSSIQQIQHWPPFPYCALIVISFTTKFRLSWDFGTAPELLTCPLLSFSVQLLATYVCVLCTLTDRCRGNWIRDQVLNRHMILTFGLTSYIISRPSWINAPWGGKLPAGQDKGLVISLDTPWASDIIGLDVQAFPDSPFNYRSTLYRHTHSRNTSSREVGIGNQKSEIQNRNSESEFGNRNLECRNFRIRNWNLEFGITN